MDKAVVEEQTQAPKLGIKAALGCTIAVAFLVILVGIIYGMVFGTPPASAVSPGMQKHAPASSPAWVAARYGWCILLTGALLHSVVKGDARKHLHYFRNIRPLMVVQNFAVIAVVIVCALCVKTLFPFLDRSWLYLFPLNGGQSINIGLLPAFIRYVGLVFVILLTLSLPELAYREERKYRCGTKDWQQGAKRSLHFGLVHCFVGVPIFVGVALSVAGLWFTHQYFRGGIERSTAHHLTYNLLLVAALLTYLVVNRIAF